MGVATKIILVASRTKKSISTNKRLYGEKEMKFEVKGSGLTKVYFSCCPDDFENWFEIISDEILEKASNCSIYYLKNQNYYPDEDEIDEYYDYLSQFSLFVIVMSRNSYNTDNRSKVIDFNYAKQYASHLLPISVDEDSNWYLDHHERQILDRNDKLTYEERLSRYLKTSIVDEPTAKKIKEAFDDYVFLSYRKKDKAYVNKVLSSIYKNKAMRDVAVWWDNYLTPGEKYSEEITENISKSKAMVLLVTPSILEKGNYIIDIEYPQATNFKKEVLPIEAEDTDKDCLSVTFKGIKTPIVLDDSSSISDSLVKLLHRENIKVNDDSEHLYYIALAYLYGFGVEKNFRKAISLLKRSSDGGCLLAKPVLRDLLQENGFSEKAIKLQYELVNSDEYMTNCDVFKEKIKYADLLTDNGHFIEALELLKSISLGDKKDRENNFDDRLKLYYYLARVYSNIDIWKLFDTYDLIEKEDARCFNRNNVEYINRFIWVLRDAERNYNLRNDTNNNIHKKIFNLKISLKQKLYIFWINELKLSNNKNQNIDLEKWHKNLELLKNKGHPLSKEKMEMLNELRVIAREILEIFSLEARESDKESAHKILSADKWARWFKILNKVTNDKKIQTSKRNNQTHSEYRKSRNEEMSKKRFEICYAFNELFTQIGNDCIKNVLQFETKTETIDSYWSLYKLYLESHNDYSEYTVRSLECFEEHLFECLEYKEVINAYELSLLVADEIKEIIISPTAYVANSYYKVGKKSKASSLYRILSNQLNEKDARRGRIYSNVEIRNDNQIVISKLLKKYADKGDFDTQFLIFNFSSQNQSGSISNEFDLFLSMVINHRFESVERLMAFRKACEIIDNINLESDDGQLRLKIILDIYDSTLFAKFEDQKFALEITEKKDFWLERIDKLFKGRSRFEFDDNIDCQWCGENIDIYLNYRVFRRDEKVKSILVDYLREFNNELTFKQREELERGIKKMCVI